MARHRRMDTAPERAEIRPSAEQQVHVHRDRDGQQKGVWRGCEQPRFPTGQSLRRINAHARPITPAFIKQRRRRRGRRGRSKQQSLRARLAQQSVLQPHRRGRQQPEIPSDQQPRQRLPARRILRLWPIPTPTTATHTQLHLPLQPSPSPEPEPQTHFSRPTALSTQQPTQHSRHSHQPGLESQHHRARGPAPDIHHAEPQQLKCNQRKPRAERVSRRIVRERRGAAACSAGTGTGRGGETETETEEE